MERKDKLFTELYPDDDDGFEEGRPLCAYAAQFRQWADQLCAEHCGSVLEIAQAKVLLLDKYFDWKNFVPRIHRYHSGDRGHFCIAHVFEHAYCQLRLAELALTPPMLFLPKPPAPPAPPVQIAAVPFGIQTRERAG